MFVSFCFPCLNIGVEYNFESLCQLYDKLFMVINQVQNFLHKLNFIVILNFLLLDSQWKRPCSCILQVQKCKISLKDTFLGLVHILFYTYNIFMYISTNNIIQNRFAIFWKWCLLFFNKENSFVMQVTWPICVDLNKATNGLSYYQFL